MSKKESPAAEVIKMGKEEKTIDILAIVFSIVFLGIAPLLNFKPAYDYTVIKDVLGALSVAIFAIALYIRRKEISLHPAGFIAGTLFFLYILAGCFYAPVKYGAAQALENYLLYYLLFLTGMLWKWENKDAFIWASAMIIASIIAFFQYPVTRYPISTFGNPNFFAGHLLMPIFLSLYFLRKKLTVIGAVYFIITFAALVITKSRASLFAFAAASSFVSFLLLKNHRISWLKYAGFFVIIVGTIIMWDRIQTQFVQDIRFYIWKGTWNMIKERIVTGWGTGNFIFHYPYFRFREYFLRPQATPITNHPHCQYLEIWAENGIIALILFGALFILAMHNGIKKHTNQSFEIFLFAFPGIIAVLVDNILSTNLTNTSTAMYFWFLLGLCFSWNKEENPILIMGSLKKIISMFFLVAMIILAGWKIYYRLIPEVYLKKGIAAREANDFATAIENYKKVCKINPNNAVALYKMAFACGQIGDLKKAEEIYLKINNVIFPHFAKTDANLATLYMQLQNFEKARQFYEKALWFNPYDIDVILGLFTIKFYHEQDINGAREYLKKAAAVNPEHEYVKYLLKTVPEFRDILPGNKVKAEKKQ